MRVGLLGARGFTGREFVRLLAGHPREEGPRPPRCARPPHAPVPPPFPPPAELQLVCASSRALVGQDALQALGISGAEAGDAVLPGLTVSDIGPAQIR